jgi:hypothetical protein
MNELSGIVGAFDRSDAEERKKLGFETEATSSSGSGSR